MEHAYIYVRCRFYVCRVYSTVKQIEVDPRDETNERTKSWNEKKKKNMSALHSHNITQRTRERKWPEIPITTTTKWISCYFSLRSHTRARDFRRTCSIHYSYLYILYDIFCGGRIFHSAAPTKFNWPIFAFHHQPHRVQRQKSMRKKWKSIAAIFHLRTRRRKKRRTKKRNRNCVARC